MSDSALPLDFEQAAAEIRRRAPTLSHAGRRAMLSIAKWIAGINVDSDKPGANVCFTIPVSVDGELRGYANMNITLLDDGTGEKVLQHDAWISPR